MKNFRFLILLLLTGTFSSSFSQAGKAISEADEKQDSVYVVDLKAVDYAFAMPAEIPSGWITFRMENMGKNNHVAMIFSSDSDLSIDELRMKIDSAKYSFPMTPVGGPGFHSPGHQSDVTVNLEPGNYIMICGLQAENGKPHFELGMQMPFKVTENPSGATKPYPDTQITLEEYDNHRTRTFATGEQTVEIVHEGYPMDFHLLEIKDPTTIDKALYYMDDLQDPSPVEWLTGVEQADSGRSTYVTYNFTPGDYAWVSHEYGIWGIMDRFQVREGDTNKELATNKKNIANLLKLNIEDHQIRIMGNPQAGANTFKGEPGHKIGLRRLKEGKEITDITDYFESEAADHAAGHHDHGPLPYRADMIKLREGSSYEATVELFSGKYAILCFEEEGETPHYEMGEITGFEVK